MLNWVNSSSTNAHHIVVGITKTSSTSIWIIDEQNSTVLNIDVQQPVVRIMWYRFLLIIIIFVTAAGNILVCLAIARERKLQNTTNYFLMSLAVADCLVAILVMPMGMMAEVLGHFPLPHYACIIFATLDVLCCTSSIWHMSTMSMDRYFTIRFPFRYGRNKTRRIMLLKIVAVWAISAAVSSPVFVLGIINKENVLSNGVCAPNNASFKIYGSIFAFYIPFIIMITTYALTMRSLRNVLVHKRKYNREKRRKQTFRPLAQIINQYAEMAQNIRRTSTTNNYNNQTTSITNTNTNNHNNNSSNNNNNNTILTKSQFNMGGLSTGVMTTTMTTNGSSTVPVDSRQTNSTESNLLQDSNHIQYGSVNMTNSTNLNSEHNNQHLTISYIKPSGSKKKRQQQQQQQQQQALAINPAIIRLKGDCDMSTVYEITECSKSTSSSHDVLSYATCSSARKSIISADLSSQPQQQHQQQISAVKTVDNKEQQKNRNVTSTLTVSTISPLKEEDVTPTTDTESPTNKIDTTYMQIVSSNATKTFHMNTINLNISWQDYLRLINYIVQYYLFIYPYRLCRLAIQSSSTNTNENSSKPCVFHQSTSTTFFNYISKINSRSISTQTNFLPPIDLSTISTATNDNRHSVINETYFFNSPKRRKSPFNRSLIASSNLFTNLFRQSPATNIRSRQWSTKSSSSLGSSPHLIQTNPSYPKQSSGMFRRVGSEIDHVLSDEHRPRASSSSSALPRSPYSQETYWTRPLRRRQQYQSRSAYFLNTRPQSYSFRRGQPLTSTTNTNSSDSSSVFHRFNSRFLSTISHQYYQQQQQQQQQYQVNSQRLRDEHIVAANERKALRVLLIIFCVFVTLWTPFFICTFISAVCEQCRERISSNLWFSITWLGYSSSMANPFIYTIFSDVFRRAFINILCCRSNESILSRQISTKFSYQKNSPLIHQQYSCRRSPNHDHSGTSTPLPYQQHPIAHLHENDVTIYINRCASDTFR